MAGATSLDGTALCLVTSTETKFFEATINHSFTQESNQARCIVFTAITLTENPAPNLPTEKRQPPVY